MESDGKFVDTGNAPEFFANGLHSVEVMGSVTRFVLYTLKHKPNGSPFREAVITVIVPSDAVAAAVRLILAKLGADGMPDTGEAVRDRLN